MCKCNLSPHDIPRNKGHLLSYQILKVWSAINFNISENMTDVLAQCIWVPSLWDNIRAVNSGLICVRDLYNTTESRFLTYREMVDKYGEVMDFLMCNKITNSISEWWKTMLRQRINGETSVCGFDAIPENIKLSKYLCWEVV